MTALATVAEVALMSGIVVIAMAQAKLKKMRKSNQIKTII
jgi:hypothetical protein